MFWFLILICCGFCVCNEGYFGGAHDDFRKLCIVLTLPGKQNGPDPDIFHATWKKYLNIAGKRIFKSLDMNAQLKVAEEHCNESKPDNDPICAFRDLSTIGNRVEHDVRNLQQTLGNQLESAWYFYAHYILVWFQHPRMSRLDCGPTSVYLGYFLAKMSHLPSFDLLFRMKSLYDYTNAKGLRQEIDNFCPASSTHRTCEIKIWINMADKVDKLLIYVGRNQWNNSASEILKNAMRLHFYAVKVTFLKLHPSTEARVSLSVTDSEVHKWIREITLFVFDSLQKNQIESIKRVIELLPYSANLPCDHAAEFPSLKRTICTFNSMIDSLTLYIANHHASNNIKQISTTIDYEKFLQEKRFEQILNIGETTQYNLQLVTQHLKLEMQKNFGELKSYFQKLAEFNWKIASADIAYISSTLALYKDASVQSANKMDGYMDQLIKAALAAAIGDQVESALMLSFAIAEACNPLKLIFAGGSATDILDAGQEVSQAMANIAKAAKLKDAFDSLINEVRKFVDKLTQNEIFLNNVASLVNSLKKYSLTSLSSSPSSLTPEFEDEKNKFLDYYKDYTPAVTKDDLRGITVYWENLIDEACDVLDSTSGTVSGITKTILAALRTCPNARVQVQKLITTYEEIYDFQFKLMDALASTMDAVAKYQAANIINSDLDAAKPKIADKPELLSAFSTIFYKISMMTAIDSYCDVLTYTEGHLPLECKGAKTSITSLLSRTKLTCKTQLDYHRIPTKPSKSGDKAFLNLKDLYAGNTAVFKIPDSQWLIDHKWIQPSQKNDIMFVQRFEIYLPVVSKTKRQVQVKVQSTVGNQLTPPDGTEYVISPRPTLWYTYREGERGIECRQIEYPNPYNDTCRDMPKICPVTIELPNCANRGNICPSIYTQWNINVYGYENADLALPSVDIPLRVAVQLCTLSESEYALMQLRDHNNRISKNKFIGQPLNSQALRTVSLTSTSPCCGSNQYYDDTADKCTACPSGSVHKYRGLFCGHEIQFVPVTNNEITFSFVNAQIICRLSGTTIASTKVMQSAVALGYHACECGWFSELTMRAPNPKVNCRGNGGLSTITCNSSNTWGVYCLNIF